MTPLKTITPPERPKPKTHYHFFRRPTTDESPYWRTVHIEIHGVHNIYLGPLTISWFWGRGLENIRLLDVWARWEERRIFSKRILGRYP